MQVVVNPTQLTATVRPVRMTARIGSSGDVLGPGSATDGQAALFDGPSGRRLRATATGAVGLALLARSELTAGSLLLGAGAGAPTELATTSYGRSFLGLADPAAGRSLLELGASDSPTFAGLTATGVVELNSTVSQNASRGSLFYRLRASGVTQGLLTTPGTVAGTSAAGMMLFSETGMPVQIATNGSAVPVVDVSAGGVTTVYGSAPGTAGAGEVRIGGGRLDAAGSITAGGSLSSITTDSATDTQVDGLVAGHRSTGTPAAGFGSNVRWVAESTTTNDRTQGLIEARWVTATDASRTARLSTYVADAAATREAWRVEADGSAVRIGFLGASAVARQSIGSAATDAATTQMLANNIRTALIGLGLCQT